MSLEHHPARNDPEMTVGLDGLPRGPPDDANFWHQLINEQSAADFLGLKDRTMQGLRHRGGGPRYIRLSSRCLRYRRADLREWADARVRTSTSDPGHGSA